MAALLDMPKVISIDGGVCGATYSSILVSPPSSSSWEVAGPEAAWLRVLWLKVSCLELRNVGTFLRSLDRDQQSAVS